MFSCINTLPTVLRVRIISKQLYYACQEYRSRVLEHSVSENFRACMCEWRRYWQPVRLVVGFFIRPRTRCLEIVLVVILRSTPEAICIFIAEVVKDELQSILCLYYGVSGCIRPQ